MKTEEDIKLLMESSYKVVERKLNIKIRNGQAMEGIRKALLWVTDYNSNIVEGAN